MDRHTPLLVLTAAANLVFAGLSHGQPVMSEPPLQSVIDRARAGDTLFVSAGTYGGNIVLSKKTALIGVGNPVLRGTGKGSVVTITADSCVLEGFVVEHCGNMLIEDDAGILLKSGGNVVRSNKLRDILFGIYLLRSHGNLIEGNEIVGRQRLELGERGSGIHLWDSHENRLIRNTISYERDGLYIQNANRTWIESNEAYALRYGLHYMYADSNTFLRNSFHDNVAGAAVMYSKGIVMRLNVFSRNRGFASYGILFQDCHGMIADSNVVADNVVGMFFEASTKNVLTRNLIARNDVALEMFANSVGNTFTENDFLDNLSPITVIGKKTNSRWNESGRGNYWSSYNGYDLDNDGIGDVPMKIQNVFSYLEGRQPNARLYLYSPVSQALAVAAEAFPIVEISSEIDRHPLMKPVMAGALQRGESTSVGMRSFLRRSGYLWIGLPLVALAGLALVLVRRFRWRVT